MKPKTRRQDRWRLLRRAVAAIAIVLIVGLTLMNPWAAMSPGIAQNGLTPSVLPNSLPNETEQPVGALCHINIDAPMPYLRCGSTIEHFQALRQAVIEGAGFDFLAKCGDMLRAKNATSLKTGVAFRSRHKTGEAFDYNQEDERVLLVREYLDGHVYWRTYLRCEKQDGSLGVKADLLTDNVGLVSAYVFDFTAAAHELGWERIPALRGWMDEASNKEFWHYQINDDLSSSRPALASESFPQ